MRRRPKNGNFKIKLSDNIGLARRRLVNSELGKDFIRVKNRWCRTIVRFRINSFSYLEEPIIGVCVPGHCRQYLFCQSLVIRLTKKGFAL